MSIVWWGRLLANSGPVKGPGNIACANTQSKSLLYWSKPQELLVLENLNTGLYCGDQSNTALLPQATPVSQGTFAPVPLLSTSIHLHNTEQWLPLGPTQSNELRHGELGYDFRASSL